MRRRWGEEEKEEERKREKIGGAKYTKRKEKSNPLKTI